ncbi:PIN domain-containing protein [Ramlibacter sp.]
MQHLVLDTNVVLDLLVFRDPVAAALDDGLLRGRWRWIATAAMRDELERVLGYAAVARRVAAAGLAPQQVLDDFDARSHRVAAPARAAVTCSDPDDQCFVDLAVHHGCALLSKDAAVLALAPRLERLGVHAGAALPVPCCRLDGA